MSSEYWLLLHPNDAPIRSDNIHFQFIIQQNSIHSPLKAENGIWCFFSSCSQNNIPPLGYCHKFSQPYTRRAFKMYNLISMCVHEVICQNIAKRLSILYILGKYINIAVKVLSVIISGLTQLYSCKVRCWHSPVYFVTVCTEKQLSSSC